MEREFIRTKQFDNNWKDMGLTEEHLLILERNLCINPLAGKVIQGTGGLRKIRWSYNDKGKKGGMRVFYVDFVVFEKIYLISVFPKNVKTDLSAEEAKQLEKMIKILEKELKGGK